MGPKSILIFFLSLLPLLSYCQQLTSRTINSGGQSRSVGNLKLEDAIGGFLISSINLPSFIFTQDFLQPDVGNTSSPIYINDVKIDGLYGIDNSGTTLIAGNSMIEFTLGETICKSFLKDTILLTQGTLQPYHLFRWTGQLNTQWVNTGNWSPSIIPTKSDEVLIPAFCPYYPIIENGIIAKCRLIKLTLGATAIVENGGQLKVGNNGN